MLFRKLHRSGGKPWDAPPQHIPGILVRVSDALERYSGRLILAAVALTLLLVIPLMALAPEENASSDPGGDVFELQDDIDDRFESLIHGNGYIVEVRGEDMLTQAALWELYQNTRALLAADERGELAPEDLPAQPYLYQAFDTDTNRLFTGLNTLADEVQRVLSHPAFGTTLEQATDEQVKLAVHVLFSNPETSALKDLLSVKARSEKRVVGGREIDYWTSPALIFGVVADNEKLGGVSGSVRELAPMTATWTLRSSTATSSGSCEARSVRTNCGASP